MNADRHTARIYQFPARPLAAARRAAPETPFVIDKNASHTPVVDFGSGWYHDAAIQSEQVPPRAG